MIRFWTGLIFNGASAITQLMSSLGIGGGINLMVWTWGNALGFFIHLVNQIILVVGYNATYGEMTDSANTAPQQAAQLDLLEAMEQRWMNWAAEDAILAVAFMGIYEDWFVAQWLLLTPEEAEAAREMEKEQWIMEFDELMEMDAMMAGGMKEGDMKEGPPPKQTDAVTLMRHHILGF